MSLLIKQILSLIKLLHSENGTVSLTFGLTFGFILGMSPVVSIQSILIFSIILLFRVQFGGALLASFFYGFIAYFFDPVFHNVGLYILSYPGLTSLFEKMYNLPIVPFTHFNNSIVMGSGVVSFLLLPFIFSFHYFFIKKYREIIVSNFKKTRFWNMFKATQIYQWYYNYIKIVE